MAAYRDRISPERLIESAEAALAAAEEIARETGQPRPYPLDLMGSPAQPAVLCNFTREEIEEACHFLVRLGELAPRVDPEVRGERID